MFNRGMSLCAWLLALALGIPFLQAPSVAADQSGQSGAAAPDVTGTWSGSFYSKHSNVAPFTMTVVISKDSHGHVVGSSSLNSDCLKGAHLQVTVTGWTVVLAGGDEQGDSITLRGTVDNAGTLLNASYVLNGSATGKCETDDGTGSLAKR